MYTDWNVQNLILMINTYFCKERKASTKTYKKGCFTKITILICEYRQSMRYHIQNKNLWDCYLSTKAKYLGEEPLPKTKISEWDSYLSTKVFVLISGITTRNKN